MNVIDRVCEAGYIQNVANESICICPGIYISRCVPTFIFYSLEGGWGITSEQFYFNIVQTENIFTRSNNINSCLKEDSQLEICFDILI